jgi:hypothetical protein
MPRLPKLHLQAYPKLALAYYQLVQILAEDHVDFIANLDPGAFHYIMASMLEGLGLKEIKNAVCACVILDNILTHHLKYVLKVLYIRAGLLALAFNAHLLALALNAHLLASPCVSLWFFVCVGRKGQSRCGLGGDQWPFACFCFECPLACFSILIHRLKYVPNVRVCGDQCPLACFGFECPLACFGFDAHLLVSAY